MIVICAPVKFLPSHAPIRHKNFLAFCDWNPGTESFEAMTMMLPTVIYSLNAATSLPLHSLSCESQFGMSS